MRYAMDARADGTLFDTEPFTQRVGPLAGDHHEEAADEVIYVLEGTARVSFGKELSKAETSEVGPGVAIFVSRGTPWSAEGDARCVSVLVHDPEPSTGHALVDLNAVEAGTATAGRAFLLGATPEVGCASVTQFIGLVPPGRAPDHFHTYDEVIYVLEGEGFVEIDGEQAPLHAGSCVHLPARVVHCLANTGDSELRLLGVFRPAGSPAEAYYPDGTLAVLPTKES